MICKEFLPYVYRQQNQLSISGVNYCFEYNVVRTFLLPCRNKISKNLSRVCFCFLISIVCLFGILKAPCLFVALTLVLTKAKEEGVGSSKAPSVNDK